MDIFEETVDIFKVSPI
ncbi:Protein of unknown function [Bacillus mycoides]|nr:Protein of unknown function [Bacillus mycoides]